MYFSPSDFSPSHGAANGNEQTFFGSLSQFWLDDKLSNQHGNGSISGIILHSGHPKNYQI